MRGIYTAHLQGFFVEEIQGRSSDHPLRTSERPKGNTFETTCTLTQAAPGCTAFIWTLSFTQAREQPRLLLTSCSSVPLLDRNYTCFDVGDVTTNASERKHHDELSDVRGWAGDFHINSGGTTRFQTDADPDRSEERRVGKECR